MNAIPRNPMRLTLTVLVVLSFLVVGMLLGRAAGQGGLALFAPTPPLGTSTYLILGYDTLEGGGHLLAVWRLTLEGSGQAHLLGLSPATIVFLADGQPAVVREVLRDPANPTLDGLQAYFTREPEAIVLIDNQAFATLVNRLGGVFLDGRSLKGQEVTEGLGALQDSPIEALHYQSRVLRALASRIPPRPEEYVIAGLAPDHLRSTLPLGELITANESRFPLLGNRITIETLDSVSAFTLPDGSQGLLPSP
ncbi:MAG: hypothetical protein NTY23_02620 [Chloroflexi bacterium]|nr:hypothetical protein [Chloroflexota bacterium]